MKDGSNRSFANHGCGDGHRTRVDARRPFGQALGRLVEDKKRGAELDKGGQRLLRIMSKETTQFMATSIYVKRVLDQWKPSGKRGLRKVIYCCFGALLGGVIAPLSLIPASREPTFLAPSAKHAPLVVGTRENPLRGKER